VYGHCEHSNSTPCASILSAHTSAIAARGISSLARVAQGPCESKHYGHAAVKHLLDVLHVKSTSAGVHLSQAPYCLQGWLARRCCCCHLAEPHITRQQSFQACDYARCCLLCEHSVFMCPLPARQPAFVHPAAGNSPRSQPASQKQSRQRQQQQQRQRQKAVPQQ
jgi:hypothetical protein